MRVRSNKSAVSLGRGVLPRLPRFASEKPDKPDPILPPPPGTQKMIKKFLDVLKQAQGLSPENDGLPSCFFGLPLPDLEDFMAPASPLQDPVWDCQWPKYLRGIYHQLNHAPAEGRQQIVARLFRQLALFEESLGPGKPCELTEILASVSSQHHDALLFDLETVLNLCGLFQAAKNLAEAREQKEARRLGIVEFSTQ